jgi:OOP family OmpA-OmpF porin
MNYRIKLLSFGVLLASLISPCFAETQAETFMFTPAIGDMLFDSNRHVKNSAFYSVSLGYQIDEVWAGETTFGVFEAQSKGTQHRSTGYHFNINGLYHFYPDQRLNPYLIGGLGLLSAQKLDWPADNAYMPRSAVTINFGAGIKYDLNPAWQIRAEAREFIVRNSINHDFDTLINVGLTWHFDNPRRTKLRNMKPVHMEFQNEIHQMMILANHNEEMH